MARPTLFYEIDYIATLIDENPELLAEIARNSDNIDEGDMIHVSDESDASIIPSPIAESKVFRISLPTLAQRLAAFVNS